MNAHSITDSFIDPMTTSLRENRLVLERLVQWKGVEPGMIFSVTDSAVYALALGLLTHDEIETHLDMLAEPAEPITIVEGSTTRVDAGGRHAWLVAEQVLDLAIAAYRVGGPAVMVENVTEPGQLAVVSAIAEKHHLSASCEDVAESGWRIAVSHEQPGRQSVLDRVRRRGIEVGHKRWFELLALSSNALATDTIVSRTHTGSFIVQQDGSVVGRREHEFAFDDDVSMLTAEKLEFRR